MLLLSGTNCCFNSVAKKQTNKQTNKQTKTKTKQKQTNKKKTKTKTKQKHGVGSEKLTIKKLFSG